MITVQPFDPTLVEIPQVSLSEKPRKKRSPTKQNEVQELLDQGSQSVVSEGEPLQES